MGDLSSNLSRFEFACKCGCGQDTVDFELIKALQEMCDHWALMRGLAKVTIRILSGNRCAAHNKAEGGKELTSQHLFGKAADFRLDGIGSEYVHRYLKKRYNDKYGLSLYSWGIHFDVRSGSAARW